jgi:hypothetical protein
MCCSTLAVEELEKPAGVECRHCTGNGCAVYEERPEVCRKFECYWLRGQFRDDERPDLIGLMVTRNTHTELTNVVPRHLRRAVASASGVPWAMTVVRDSGRATPDGRRLLNRLLREATVSVQCNGSSVVLPKAHTITRKEWVTYGDPCVHRARHTRRS